MTEDEIMERSALMAAHMEATARMEAESARLTIARDRGSADYRAACRKARDEARQASEKTAAALAAWDAKHVMDELDIADTKPL